MKLFNNCVHTGGTVLRDTTYKNQKIFYDLINSNTEE